ncbi:unnamed protein product, partial [Nippostrongylus brasiliensis]|uniref:BBS2_C domain-containing protein n=1 Tax=Nippostrongylus brasiliensis TaxID=27835 RepID=A0A0N4YUU4_NIPBR
MRISLGELRKSLQGKQYLISSFSYKNLVIFCDGYLTFVYGFVNNNGLAEYSRSVKVILSPRIPDHVEISSMSAILDGSLVVLSSADSLFIVRVSADLIYHAENICDVPRMTIDYVSFMCASDRTCEGYGSNSYGFFKSIESPIVQSQVFKLFRQKIVLQSTERDLARVPAEERSIVSEKALNAILARKETLRPIGPASSRQQLFKNLTEFFVSAQKNQVVLCAALEMSKDRIEVLMKLATQLSEKQNALNQRLLQ